MTTAVKENDYKNQKLCTMSNHKNHDAYRNFMLSLKSDFHSENVFILFF